MIYKIKPVKRFTFDFNKYCRKTYSNNGKFCAIGQYLLACGFKSNHLDVVYQMSNFIDNDDENFPREFVKEIATINDSHMSRLDKSIKLKGAFKKYGIRVDIKGLKKTT